MDKNIIIAHRGLHNDKIKENTLEAFKEAIDKKYSIELDIHNLKDNEIIVFHDSNLKRMFNINKILNDLTYNELKKITNYYIPTLKEVLSLVDGKVDLLIEIKNNFNNFFDLVNLLNNYKGNYIIQSFYLDVLINLKKYNIKTCLLISKHLNSNLIDNFIYKKIILDNKIKPDYLAIKKNIISDKKLLRLRKKYKLFVWLVTNRKEYNELKDKYNYLICEDFI